ncbi:MAG: hypothetical protein LBG15_08095 [Dysgonamonadaceae bacterium]|jgi:uncharacterized membrane protein (DUF485 family)|nr:hypothetical protein [Dysgonamonadaceae bacterium]
MEEDKRQFLQTPNQGDAIGGDKVAGDKFNGDKVGGNKVELSGFTQEMDKLRKEIRDLKKCVEDKQGEHSSFDDRIKKLEDSNVIILLNISNIKRYIDKANNRFEKLKKEYLRVKYPKWVYWVWLTSIVALILSIAAIYMDSGLIWNVESVSISIVLAFVGILATFIVIGNYAQVKDIEKKFDDKMVDNSTNFDKKVTELNITNSKKIIAAKCRIEMQLVSVYSRPYSYNPNAIIECLAYVIEDSGKISDESVISELILTLENQLNSGRNPFYDAELSVIEYCLNIFMRPLTENEKISQFRGKIKTIYDNRRIINDVSRFINDIGISIDEKNMANANCGVEVLIKRHPLAQLKEIDEFLKSQILPTLNNEKFNELEKINDLRDAFKVSRNEQNTKSLY